MSKSVLTNGVFAKYRPFSVAEKADAVVRRTHEDIRQEAARALTGMRPFPPYGHLVPIEEFIQHIQYGYVNRLDILAFYAYDFGVSDEIIKYGLPDNTGKYTHVWWRMKL